MNCNFTEKISSMIDGELSQSEMREVERHLLSCGECQQMRADFLNLRSQIANFETSLQPTVQNRALKKILSPERRTPALGLQWGFGKAVAFASLLITGLILGLLVYQSSKSTGPDRALQAGVPSASPVPTASVEEPKPATPEQSPQPSPGQEQPTSTKDDKESKNPPRKAPAPKRIVREPKPYEQFASVPELPDSPERVRSGDAETMTAMHFDKSETLLRSFRNLRLNEPGSAAEVSYERSRAQQLVYQNMMLRREADQRGDIQVASLLENLEPILLDISNLPDIPDKDAVRVIRERVERKNIVALLRVNSTALARALDD